MVLMNGLRPEDVIALLPVNVSQEGENAILAMVSRFCLLYSRDNMDLLWFSSTPISEFRPLFN